MTAMNLELGVLHFVGIGGIGMSGIAEMLNSLGYQVQGSDIADGANVKRLREKGIRVFVGHEAGNIEAENGDMVAAVVISSAVKDDNAEVQAARANKIPVVRRAEMLAELMRLKRAVAVAGTHGKTTTTSMIGEMLGSAGVDPSVINGGIVNAYGTNVRMGQSDWIVVEADESDGTFTRLPVTVAVVTNMDAEHLDHYGTFENVRKAYRRFIHNLPFYGFAVLCMDHPEVQALITEVRDRTVITYGFSPQADIRAVNLRFSAGESVFDVEVAGWLNNDGAPHVVKDICLPMVGEHNVQNALAALSIGWKMGIEIPLLKKGLSEFKGVKRRFSKTGDVQGVRIIDDYAHHPKEIETVLNAARHAVSGTKGRIIAVMQPHRYSRLDDLFEEFCTCFNEADHVLIADVYAAGESPIEGADRDALVDGIAQRGHKSVKALPSQGDLATEVATLCQPDDLVICMGAGNITAWAHELPAELEQALSKKASAA